MERPIVIEDREELIYMLCEASELEHMIMCEYLFAAFSLKHDVSEGLTAAQVEAVRRWERIISGVAAQEMLHLALASNLLTAIGASPHLGRPNLPQRARYYPPGVQLALLPVTDLASAVAAIETIVEQGEGARGDWKEAHYGTFLGILDEYRVLKQ